jgi:hypothetical protein
MPAIKNEFFKHFKYFIMILKLNGVTISEVELANWLLKIAFEEAKTSPDIQNFYNVTPAQLEQVEQFRKKLVEAYLQTAGRLNSKFKIDGSCVE